MDDFQKLERKAFGYLMLFFAGATVAALSLYYALHIYAGLTVTLSLIIAGIFTLFFSMFAALLASRYLLKPFRMLWQAILHVSPESTSVGPPNLEQLHYGRQLVTSLANRVYQFASQQGVTDKPGDQNAMHQAADIVSHFPLPMFVFNKDQVIVHASDATMQYLALEKLQFVGQHIADSVHLEFPGEHNLQTWITDCQVNKATDYAYWQRVQIHLRDGTTIKQCDMAAYYNRDNEYGAEFIVTLFDRTDQYQRDDQDLSFIALAVHELRTPLTTLRGYIEALDEDLEGKLTPELQGYMNRLSLSADQLSAFVATILNVVRIEENQLQLHLIEADWDQTLRNSAAIMVSRAGMLDKAITFRIQPGLPKVAVDQVSIGEVINNLLDNAIKYSTASKEIVVSANLTNEGFIETTVQDFGVGIPESVLPNLFEKFYRNHRTKASIGGTGLGLYLTKAIVDAHGGHIWVKSKVGEGSTFGFTLQQYAHLAEEVKTSNNDTDITRHAHGWIKNHSLYRK